MLCCSAIAPLTSLKRLRIAPKQNDDADDDHLDVNMRTWDGALPPSLTSVQIEHCHFDYGAHFMFKTRECRRARPVCMVYARACARAV